MFHWDDEHMTWTPEHGIGRSGRQRAASCRHVDANADVENNVCCYIRIACAEEALLLVRKGIVLLAFPLVARVRVFAVASHAILVGEARILLFRLLSTLPAGAIQWGGGDTGVQLD